MTRFLRAGVQWPRRSTPPMNATSVRLSRTALAPRARPPRGRGLARGGGPGAPPAGPAGPAAALQLRQRCPRAVRRVEPRLELRHLEPVLGKVLAQRCDRALPALLQAELGNGRSMDDLPSGVCDGTSSDAELTAASRRGNFTASSPGVLDPDRHERDSRLLRSDPGPPAGGPRPRRARHARHLHRQHRTSTASARPDQR
jgi:hypothetical protein